MNAKESAIRAFVAERIENLRSNHGLGGLTVEQIVEAIWQAQSDYTHDEIRKAINLELNVTINPKPCGKEPDAVLEIKDKDHVVERLERMNSTKPVEWIMAGAISILALCSFFGLIMQFRVMEHLLSK